MYRRRQELCNVYLQDSSSSPVCLFKQKKKTALPPHSLLSPFPQSSLCLHPILRFSLALCIRAQRQRTRQCTHIHAHHFPSDRHMHKCTRVNTHADSELYPHKAPQCVNWDTRLTRIKSSTVKELQQWGPWALGTEGQASLESMGQIFHISSSKKKGVTSKSNPIPSPWHINTQSPNQSCTHLWDRTKTKRSWK